MKKLTKEMETQRAELITRLETALEAVEDSRGKVEDAVLEYNGKIDELNTALLEANEFVTQVTDAMQEYIDEKSEKWAEGEAGSAYVEWMDTWQNIELTDAERIDVPEPLEGEAPIQLGELPSEPG